MNAKNIPILVVLTLLACSAASPADRAAGTPGGAPDRLKVFLDWPGCDVDFFRTQVAMAEFVDGLEGAQVHLQVTPGDDPAQPSLVVAFNGRGEFQGDNNTLAYSPPAGERPEDTVKSLAGLLKIGLLRYVAKTPAAKDVTVSFLDQVKPTSVVDKWNFWVFNLSANSFFMGETHYHNSMYFGSFSANRVTPELKVRTSVYGNLESMWFDLGDSVYENSTHGYGFSGLVVKSLSDHWSAGAFVNVESSTYMNLRLSVSAAPAVEYDVFPYSESTKRQLRFLYRIGYTGTRYHEETVYFKLSESLFRQSLSMAYEVKKPWGTVSLELEGSNFLHDFSKNRLVLNGEVSVRIWKGLSFELFGRYARIRDQLSLPRGGASYEEVLLRQQQLATGHEYRFAIGLSYTFGSTRSTVVNPRFGNGGRGMSISF